jgi:glyoxylase-like metal-dependent hydrolase (beta-lactamase superfamily II)
VLGQRRHQGATIAEGGDHQRVDTGVVVVEQAPFERRRGRRQADEVDQRIGYEVGYPGIFPAWFRVFDRLETLPGTTEIVPGCRVVSRPGHTPGSAGAVFETARGRTAVVGDLVNQVENLRAPGGGHIPPALYSDLDACLASLALLETEADEVLVSHDYRMLRRAR